MAISADSKYRTLQTPDATVEVPCGGYGTAGFQIAGTFTGTLTFECTVDNGTWQTLNVTKTNSTSQVTTATAPGVWVGSCAGLQGVRVRMSAYTNGAADVRILVAGTGGGGGSSGGGGGGGGTSSDFGAAFPAEGTAIGFDDGTNMVPGNMNADGGIEVHVTNGGSGGNTAAGPTGDPVPADADFQGFEDPSGDLEGEKHETFDVNTGAGTDNKTVFIIGRATPTGGLPISQATGMPGSGNTAKDGSGTEHRWLSDADGHQQVDVLASELPTGAATLAEQQTQTTVLGTLLTSANFAAAFGTAGTADTQVMSVQGIAGMTKLLVTPDANSAINLAQVNGQTVDVGAGNAGTGTPRISIATDDVNLSAINAVAGVTSGTKVITDANGTLQQYLRGLVYLAIQPTKQITGSAQTVINTATDIAAGNFSGAPAATFSNNDAAVPNALYANAMAEFPDWGAAPAAGTVVELWGVLKDVDGTDDDTDAPSGTSSGGARYFGAWIIAAVDALQRSTIVIPLSGINGSITCDFYIKNGTAQNMNNDGGTSCVVKITPWSYGAA